MTVIISGLKVIGDTCQTFNSKGINVRYLDATRSFYKYQSPALNLDECHQACFNVKEWYDPNVSISTFLYRLKSVGALEIEFVASIPEQIAYIVFIVGLL